MLNSTEDSNLHEKLTSEKSYHTEVARSRNFAQKINLGFLSSLKQKARTRTVL